jgi:hypothetical protein
MDPDPSSSDPRSERVLDSVLPSSMRDHNGSEDSEVRNHLAMFHGQAQMLGKLLPRLGFPFVFRIGPLHRLCRCRGYSDSGGEVTAAGGVRWAKFGITRSWQVE